MKTTFQLKNKKELLILILIISIAILSISLAYVFGYKDKIQPNQPIVQEQPQNQVSELRQNTLKGTSDEEIMTYLYGNYDEIKKESIITLSNRDKEQLSKENNIEYILNYGGNIKTSSIKTFDFSDKKAVFIISNNSLSGLDNIYIFKKTENGWSLISSVIEYSKNGSVEDDSIEMVIYGRDKYALKYITNYSDKLVNTRILHLRDTSKDNIVEILNHKISSKTYYSEYSDNLKNDYYFTSMVEFIKPNSQEFYNVKITRSGSGSESEEVLNKVYNYKFNSDSKKYEEVK